MTQPTALIVESNHGNDWHDAIDPETGQFRTAPIYLHEPATLDDPRPCGFGLTIEGAQQLRNQLKDALDALHKARREWTAPVPTEPGLYVHPRFRIGDDVSTAMVLQLAGPDAGSPGWWLKGHYSEPGRRLTTADVQSYADEWGGLARLEAAR